ncbi:hypothetical protein AURDEDRAFT_126199 [Auricularia subglabra TFB-10046 SS5]|nr:hypothetical protein AURDEDRAFT_126199 [Auricularia subglabra TFB-10046 SS5]
MLIGIIVPVVILSLALFTLLFLLWRKKRRRDASRPAPGFAVAAATPVAFPEHFSDRASDSDTLSVVPAMSPIDSKRAHHATSPSVSESDASRFSGSSPVAVSPVEMAELTAAMQRAGLSVNELMSSLNRVSRLDAHGAAGEAMPPRYEA